MRATLYKLLNKDAKAWWYHKQLREHGDYIEARKHERASIRRHVRDLAQAKLCPGAYALVGYGGCSLYPHEDKSISGISERSGFWLAIITFGIQTLDVRPVIDAGKWTIKTPMIAVGKTPDLAPYHALSYAPRDYVFADYAARGAIIHNWTDPSK